MRLSCPGQDLYTSLSLRKSQQPLPGLLQPNLLNRYYTYTFLPGTTPTTPKTLANPSLKPLSSPSASIPDLTITHQPFPPRTPISAQPSPFSPHLIFLNEVIIENLSCSFLTENGGLVISSRALLLWGTGVIDWGMRVEYAWRVGEVVVIEGRWGREVS